MNTKGIVNKICFRNMKYNIYFLILYVYISIIDLIGGGGYDAVFHNMEVQVQFEFLPYIKKTVNK